MDKTITRSTVNSQEYNAPEFPKSGFNLSYRDYNDYMLGRWHTSGFQWVMPSDKFSGHNKGNFTFNRIVTPMVAPVHVGQYNVYCTLRSIDNTFQENVAPSKHNGFSSEWSMPTTNTKVIVEALAQSYGFTAEFISEDENYSEFNYSNVTDWLRDMVGWQTEQLDDGAALEDLTIGAWLSDSMSGNKFPTFWIEDCLKNLTEDTGLTNSLFVQAQNMYCVDALKDIRDYWTSRFPSWLQSSLSSMTVSEFLYNFLDCFLTPFVGRYSYYADFGYNYIRPSDIYRIAHSEALGGASFFYWFDDTPMNEYPLRAMYAFWYDRCRDINLQPVSSTLPKPRQFGSTSILDLSAGGNLMYLLYRIRRWTENMFISAQPDSPARHVFAPIYQSSATVTQNDENAFATNAQEKITSATVSYLDPLTGSAATVTCPVPSIVNDALSHLNQDSIALDYALPLQALRQAQQLERYLKRLDYFGDEYNDYMLSQYNSRVSDLRINHPEILSQSIDDANYEQEIANMSNGISNAGDRTATGTLSCSGDGYTSFAEEFGIVINVITFMPDDTYDGATPQLLMRKLVDMPLPIFAANNDELGRIMEIAANGLSPAMNGNNADYRYMFGHYPAYHGWRSRVDRVRGCFLNEMQDCLFRRFYGLDSAENTPRLNYEFINCRPNLQMFANTVRYDCQLYGDVIHEFYVERVLPTPVETI